MVPPQDLVATVSETFDVCTDERVLKVTWSDAVISCGGSVWYELSVTPPPPDCLSGSGECTFNTNNTQMNLNVTVGETYSLCVRAVDCCGNAQMQESDCISILVTINMEGKYV